MTYKKGVPYARTMEQADPDKPVSCPNCKCEQLMFIEVAVFGGMIYGGEGTGKYFGCPACPWASPMEVVSKKEKEEEEEQKAVEEQKAREKAEAHESYHDAGSYDHDVEERWRDAEDGLSGDDDEVGA